MFSHADCFNELARKIGCDALRSIKCGEFTNRFGRGTPIPKCP